MKKTIKLLLLVIVITSTSSTLLCQDNIVSIGVPGLVIGNVNLGYERVVSEKTSLALHLGILIPREVPAYISDEFDDGGELLDEFDNKLGGMSAALEYRLYTGDKGAPRGFYAAPFVRMNNYSFTIGTEYDQTSAELKARLFSIGAGVQLGAQWLIDDKVSLDLYFLGLGVNNHTFSFELASNDPNADFQAFEGEIRADLAEEPLLKGKVKVESGDDYVKASASTLSLGIRGGFTIGYAF